MFWDKVAWVYDLFADFYNGKTHKELCREVAGLVSTTDDVLECACGTGMLTGHLFRRRQPPAPAGSVRTAVWPFLFH